jgi:hypothetical protein
MSKESRQVTTQFIERKFQNLRKDVIRTRQEDQGGQYDEFQLEVTVGAWNPTVKRLADLEEMLVPST